GPAARGAGASPQGARLPGAERAEPEPARFVRRPVGLLVPHGRPGDGRDGAREGVPVRQRRGPRAVRRGRSPAPPLQRELRRVRVVRAADRQGAARGHAACASLHPLQGARGEGGATLSDEPRRGPFGPTFWAVWPMAGLVFALDRWTKAWAVRDLAPI